jgi:hypothetical protein
MCFSTAASFGAGVLLTGAGILAARKSQKPAQWAFAAIPGIFAVQQFSEGFVWLSLSNESYAPWAQAATFLFLFFAEVLWPAWVPFAMLTLEKDRRRRQILFGLLVLGLLFSIQSLYGLLAYPFSAKISEHHIQYHLDASFMLTTFAMVVYGLVAVIPTFISSVTRMWLVGLPIAVSFWVAKILYPYYVISIWCYFAAIISVTVVYVLARMLKSNDLERNHISA